ncbi:MAG: AI-2E family transporter, partial [Clostridia bacterium]|nr:AI-2E family transporter [Clostridia bacterium]
DSYLHTRLANRVRYVVRVIDGSFHSFIVGQCVEAVVLGCLCIIGMLIFRFPYATMIGCLVGFTALIPVAGAYIGAAVGAFMIFTVEPIQALFFVIFLVVLQQLEGTLIYPRVVGASIGLPGVWVLAAVTIGGGVLGVGGMLLGVPLAAAVYQLLRNDVTRREKEGVIAGAKMKRILEDEK